MQRTGGRLFDYQLKPDATTNAGAEPRRKEGDSGAPLIGAQIQQRNPLIDLAQQFGEASGLRGGLRSALGTPQSTEPIKRLTEPHQRGSIFVAAVFDAFFSTYVRRTFDLFRIFRAGGGSAQPVDLPAPLADQLCIQAVATADQFFKICVRALDYCPPVDIRFGDFLRAVITAHWDHDEADVDGIRDTWMQAFRLRGIQAEGARFFSENALRWPTGRDLGLPPIEGLEADRDTPRCATPWPRPVTASKGAGVSRGRLLSRRGSTSSIRREAIHSASTLPWSTEGSGDGCQEDDDQANEGRDEDDETEDGPEHTDQDRDRRPPTSSPEASGPCEPAARARQAREASEGGHASEIGRRRERRGGRSARAHVPGGLR
jgi:hypothetical protein